MHVMHVIDTMHGGGAETSLLEMVPGLAARGVKTTIVTLLPDDGALEGRIRAQGVRRIRLVRSNPVAMTADLSSIVKRENPDLLHTTLMYANLAGRIAGRATKTAVVTTLANLDYGPEHRASSCHGPWGVRAAQAADLTTAPLTMRFHAISEEVAETMRRRLLIPARRIRVIYRGRDPERLGLPSVARRARVRRQLSVEPQTPVVLSVGRLDRQKGVTRTLEAFRVLRKQVPDAVLLIAGRPGDETSAVEEIAAGIPGVRLLGHRPDVPDLMCAADVLSFPSRWEGLGGTLVEAMALELTIVGSDIPAIAETLGDVGWPLVSPDDAGALAAALASLLAGGPANQAKKQAGRERFLSRFAIDGTAEAMANFYQEAVSSARSRRNGVGTRR